MSSSILHRCPFCGHVTDISDMLADFIENPHCSQCGLSASEGNLKMQDDLVALFNKQMHVEAPVSPERQEGHFSAPQITYSVTQHYHHSGHVAQRAAATQTSSPMMNGTANSIYEALKRNNIDPSSLSSHQLELFANAMPEQQSRLIQVWQICPEPSKSAQSITQPSQLYSRGDLEMCDSTREQNRNDDFPQYAEPYMTSGYGLTTATHVANEPTTGSPYKPSSDPIYQTQGQRWWERTQTAAVMEY